MRTHRLAAVAVAAALAVGGLLVGADLSGAGDQAGTLQANPPESVEPATVTVSNSPDDASTCQLLNGGPQGAPTVSPPSMPTVSLNLTGTNGTTQMNTVTPDASGNFTQTYTGLTAGTYTVTGSCDLPAQPTADEATPQAGAPFTYTPVTFVVTAPAGPVPPPPPPPPPPVPGRPAFTG
jgi:hypothetical protein